MLKHLRVNSFAIIDELDVSFDRGLNVLSGETGAGKSILIGALGLVLGERAYSEMIKTGRTTATVEAEFNISGLPILKELGIEDTGTITIKRVVSRQGKGKAYVNSNQVSVQALNTLGKSLVDVHGQHEHQSLLSTDNQTELLDRYGSLETDREKVAKLYSETSAIRRKLDAIKRDSQDREKRVDFLSFQVSEINGAALEPDEDVRLEEEFSILSNLGKLRQLVEGAYEALYSEDGSAQEKAASALASIEEAAEIDEELAGALDSLAQASALLEDASISVRDMRDKYEMEPGRLDFVQERIEEINRLKKKYGKSIEEIHRFRDEASEELEALENADQSAEELEKAYAQSEAKLVKAAGELSAKRKKASVKLEKSIMEELKGLALKDALFKVSFDEGDLTATGMDVLEFLFSANKGEMVKPLGKVASGGELSRIMLAIKNVLREVDPIGVLVFDEVDAGIGGKTAVNVADALSKASDKRQVLCITHLPQIAARGDRHLLIEKKSGADDTQVAVRELTGKQRQEEIARMLSGSVTEASLEHAGELLGQG